MYEQIISSLLISVSALWLHSPIAPSSRPIDQGKAPYTCEPVIWNQDAGMHGDNFEGGIQASCSFDGTSGGGFTQLSAFINDQVIHGKNVQQVFSGPTPETFDKLPSNYYDVSEKFGHGSDTAVVRSDEHVATDLSSVLILATLSKDIQGEGNAQYLKETDITATVRSTTTRAHYTIEVKAFVKIEKPWFAPSGTFENMIRDQVQKQTDKTENELITEIAQHI